MKATVTEELEASDDIVTSLEKNPELFEFISETFHNSDDYELIEKLCVILSDTFRGTTEKNDASHHIMALLPRKCACLQFLPSILTRYLSLLVSQSSHEEMVLSFIEAFLVVICTNNTRKLTRSASLNDLRHSNANSPVQNDSLIVVPSLLTPSVYMYNNEVLFRKDFISYPSNRIEFLRLRKEPPITKLDSSNRSLDGLRQEVLSYAISQYNSYISELDSKSHKYFCLMCSHFALSGFDVSKLKSLSRSKQLVNVPRKRFVLSQFLFMEMLQGLYQLSFLLSVREDSLQAIDHIAFRARHSMMPQLILLVDSIKFAIERSCLKQETNSQILAEPEVSYLDRVGAVTSDSLRITARRESIRLDQLITAATNANGPTHANNTAPHPHPHHLPSFHSMGSHNTGVEDSKTSSQNKGTLRLLEHDGHRRRDGGDQSFTFTTTHHNYPSNNYENNNHHTSSHQNHHRTSKSKLNQLKHDSNQISESIRTKVLGPKAGAGTGNADSKHRYTSSPQSSHVLPEIQEKDCGFNSRQTSIDVCENENSNEFDLMSSTGSGGLQSTESKSSSQRRIYCKNNTNNRGGGGLGSNNSSVSSPKGSPLHNVHYSNGSTSSSTAAAVTSDKKSAPIFKLGDSLNDGTQCDNLGYYSTSSYESSPSKGNKLLSAGDSTDNELDQHNTTAAAALWNGSTKSSKTKSVDLNVVNKLDDIKLFIKNEDRNRRSGSNLYVDDENDGDDDDDDDVVRHSGDKSIKRNSAPLAIVTEL